MIGILLIATRKYKQFIPALIEQIDRYFISGKKKIIYLFTDYLFDMPEKKDTLVIQKKIPDYKFPYATLYRYMIFTDSGFKYSDCTHLFYMDVDMAIVAPIHKEFLVDGLLAIKHPAFTHGGWGSPNCSERSTAWFPADKRIQYYCGGVQGGEKDAYLEACRTMAENIKTDEDNGVMAEWHDETHWNKYCNYERPEIVTVRGAEYCMVEQKHLRANWGIDGLVPKIIALAKNHKTIRE